MLIRFATRATFVAAGTQNVCPDTHTKNVSKNLQKNFFRLLGAQPGSHVFHGRATSRTQRCCHDVSSFWRSLTEHRLEPRPQCQTGQPTSHAEYRGFEFIRQHWRQVSSPSHHKNGQQPNGGRPYRPTEHRHSADTSTDDRSTCRSRSVDVSIAYRSIYRPTQRPV